jgi:hypothetical protein
MRVISASNRGAQLELSPDDLCLLNNALNEVCNGVDVPEFHTRMGASLEEARNLLDVFHELCGNCSVSERD